MEESSQITPVYFKYVLRRYRLQAELSQEQISGLLGVSRGFYSLLELGRKWPNVDMLIRIASVLGVRPGELLDATVEEARRDSCRKIPT